MRRLAMLSITAALFAAVDSAAPAVAHHRARAAGCGRGRLSARSAHRRHCAHIALARWASLSGGLTVGVNASVGGWADMASRLDQVSSQSGSHWIREELSWSRIEPRPGVFDFSHFDQLMLLAAQRGIRVLAQLLDAPAWAAPTPSSLPSDPSAYAGYVAAVVRRYGPGGSFWSQNPDLAAFAVRTFELWNEPYAANGNGGDYEPGRYARLVKAAVSAGRASDPQSRFLIGAEMQSALTGGRWEWWVDALYQAVPDLNNYFDGVSVHPYGTDLEDVSYPQHGQPYRGYEQIRRIEALRSQFIEHGAAEKPFWITEVGWPTNCSRSTRCVDLAKQAANLTTLFTYAQTTWRHFLQAVFIYDYTDCGTDSSNPENDYGLAYNDGTPKPALAVFRARATS